MQDAGLQNSLTMQVLSNSFSTEILHVLKVNVSFNIKSKEQKNPPVTKDHKLLKWSGSFARSMMTSLYIVMVLVNQKTEKLPEEPGGILKTK